MKRLKKTQLKQVAYHEIMHAIVSRNWRKPVPKEIADMDVRNSIIASKSDVIPPPTLKFDLTLFHTKPDKFGNVLRAFELKRLRDGVSVSGKYYDCTVSDMIYVVKQLIFSPQDTYSLQYKSITQRQYHTSGWRNSGCDPHAVLSWIVWQFCELDNREAMQQHRKELASRPNPWKQS